MMQTDQDTEQTRCKHIRHTLCISLIVNLQPKKNYQYTLYINQSLDKVFIVSIHLLTHHFLNMGGEIIIGCPVTQPVGLIVHPHYCYLPLIIIFKKVPLYDVPWDILLAQALSSTRRLYPVPRVMSPNPFHRRPYLDLENHDLKVILSTIFQ